MKRKEACVPGTRIKVRRMPSGSPLMFRLFAVSKRWDYREGAFAPHLPLLGFFLSNEAPVSCDHA